MVGTEKTPSPGTGDGERSAPVSLTPTPLPQDETGLDPLQARYALVAVPVPLRRLFTYRIPDALAGEVRRGSQVHVPFGRRRTSGFVVGLTATTEVSPVKDLAGVEDPDLSLPPEVLTLCRWVADYYIAPLGEVLRAALPAGLGKKSPGEVPRAEGALPDIRLGPEQEEALRVITASLRGGIPGPFLLHGVTGSGKTEVYLRAAREVVSG